MRVDDSLEVEFVELGQFGLRHLVQLRFGYLLFELIGFQSDLSQCVVNAPGLLFLRRVDFLLLFLDIFLACVSRKSL